MTWLASRKLEHLEAVRDRILAGTPIDLAVSLPAQRAAPIFVGDRPHCAAMATSPMLPFPVRVAFLAEPPSLGSVRRPARQMHIQAVPVAIIAKGPRTGSESQIVVLAAVGTPEEVSRHALDLRRAPRRRFGDEFDITVPKPAIELPVHVRPYPQRDDGVRVSQTYSTFLALRDRRRIDKAADAATHLSDGLVGDAADQTMTPSM